MKLTPFWVDDHPRPGDLGSDPLPSDTDVLVVGSGLTGLSAALRLARSGQTVTVIDRAEIAGGASSINAGMVSPDVKAGITTIFERHGPEIGKEMWHSTVRSVELVRGLARDPAVDALVDENGMAALGHGERKRRSFEKTVAWYQQNLGVDWEILTGSDVGRVVGGDHFDVALYEPEGFGVHPARLSFGLAGLVQRAGALLVGLCAAESIEATPSGLRVKTSRGSIDAGQVIIATNGYTTREPIPRLARLVVPIGSYIIVTEPLGRDGAERIFPGGTMTYTKHRLLNYMRRTHDHRVLLGGRRSLHPDLDLDESSTDLRRALVKYWPNLEEAAITHVWGGRLGIPFDLTPHIGRVNGAWYAMGYAGHGVGLSCQLGLELAGMLLGEDPPSVYSRIAHQGRFYYTGGRAWFLTPASHLYRTLDKVGI